MKSSQTSLAIVGVISLIVGLGIGHVASRAPADAEPDRAHAAAESELLTARAEVSRLEGDYQELEQALESVRAEKQGLEARLRTSEARAPGTVEPEQPNAGSETARGTVDWERLSEVLASNVDVFRLHRLGETELTEEQEAALATLWKEWSAAGAVARAENPYAFLDEEYLPDILSVVLGTTLNLTDDQVARISGHALDLLARNHPDENTTPLEAYGMRQTLIQGVEALLEDSLAGTQREDYDTMRPWVNQLLRGEQSIRILGLEAERASRVQLRQGWRKAYGFERGQVPDVDRVIDDYLGSHRSILERYGQLGGKRRELSPEENLRMDQEVLALGLRTEQRILPHLTPSQREALPEALPLLIRVEDSNSIMRGTTGYAGF